MVLYSSDPGMRAAARALITVYHVIDTFLAEFYSWTAFGGPKKNDCL